MHRLFTAPAEEITTELVQDFLDQRVPEGHVVEYKRQVTPEVVEVIASCANTYGGVILVGVDAQRPARDLPGDVLGVPRDAKEDLVNKMNNLLEPPWWSPEVLPVPYGTDGKVVLVIRVDAAAAPRPVMYQGYLPIRMDGRKAKADRRLIKLLLDEPQPVPLEPPETPARPPTHQLSPFYGDGIPAGTAPDLALRLATTLPLWPPPPVEYHLCAGTTATDDNPFSPLTVDQVVDFDSLGERTGLQAVYQCYSGFLEVQEFVDVMALEVMEKIAMDCGYLIPRALEVPRLPGHIRIETLF